MRKWIIDTDTGSDDAVALLLALGCGEVEVLGITTVAGNVPLDKATRNALMTVQVAGAKLPVYPGAAKPLFRNLVTAVNVHGQDGMGDIGLIHPDAKPQQRHAVDYILDTVRAAPGEIELVTIGPVTNIALAILKEPETMRQVKHIWSMAGAGFGVGNTTPVAEFNVYVDAESFAVLLGAGIPLTMIGTDVCFGQAAWDEADMALLEGGGEAARYAVQCNRTLCEFNLRRCGQKIVDLPDAVAMAVALWPDITLDAPACTCYCCTKEEPAYGQVIVDDHSHLLAIESPDAPANAAVVRKIEEVEYKNRLNKVLLAMR